MGCAAEREYECVGWWREEGLLYTYTRRLDTATPTYECFVGQGAGQGAEQQLSLAEAGPDCRRGLRPDTFGMQLRRTSRH